MNLARSSRLHRRALLVITLAVLALLSLAAQHGPLGASPRAALPNALSGSATSARSENTTESAERRSTAVGARAPERLPGPFWLALFAVVVGGAVGAFAADLVTDGRIERPTHDSHGWMLGMLGKLIVGAVAAVVVLTVNPTAEWWMLLGTAVTAGLGGEAILLSRLAAGQAQEAKKDREHAERNLARISALSVEQLETLRTLTIEAYQAGPGAVTGSNAFACVAVQADGFERIVNAYTARARAEFAAAAN